ncbi:hypothetical protein IH879_21325 [candidate division KSB1 bacterium]|nr:hypothetical protein [candidate division KSB1 bacterium]
MTQSNHTQIANQFDKLFAETSTKIKRFSGATIKDKRQFVYAILLMQISQLLSLVDMQKKI